MNAIPAKPLKSDPHAGEGGISPEDAEAENIRLRIDFEDEPEDLAAEAGNHKDFAGGAGNREDFARQDASAANPSLSRRAGAPRQAERADTRATDSERSGSRDSEPPQSSAARRRATQPAAESGGISAVNVPPQLAGIEVTLTVEIGSHRLPLKDLLSIDPGQLFALDRMTADPVAILVNGKPFALGEIVAIGDRFGVRLVDIVNPEGS